MRVVIINTVFFILLVVFTKIILYLLKRHYNYDNKSFH
jgi:hypothetical protein